MQKYLYGAAVQGIQEYILRTNKLKDIVHSSHIVAEICTGLFYELLTGKELSRESLDEAMEDDKRFILHAAGNIKYIFDSEEECAKVVLEFPRRVMQTAPGITVSQAVVCYEDGDFANAVDELECRLRIQRNKPARSQTFGLMGIARSPQTGLPVRNENDKKTGSKDLYVRAFGIDFERVEMQVDKLTRDDNSWIAVIHADGNGLGSIVQKVGKDPDRFKKFSERLDKATVLAAQAAYLNVKDRWGENEDIPIRPVVLSGDDLTVICRGDIAFDYTSSFIRNFEEKTAGLFDGLTVFTEGKVRDRMTACAGIAFVKSNYPYYYAYELAKSLCSAAKTDAKDTDNIRQGKELPQSCILFHKVQGSFNGSYEEIVERELSPKQSPGICLKGGPYYLRKKTDRRTIEQLTEILKTVKTDEMGPVRSSVRRWLSALYENKGMADQLLKRAKSMASQNEDILTKLTSEIDGNVMAYDVLALNSIMNNTD